MHKYCDYSMSFQRNFPDLMFYCTFDPKRSPSAQPEANSNLNQDQKFRMTVREPNQQQINLQTVF